jgi:hypothetical protein
MCDLWWTKWHWDRFLPEYFGFPLSILFHLLSITSKTKKLIIFITGLHTKPQGCGASVLSAAGPFTPPPKSLGEVGSRTWLCGVGRECERVRRTLRFVRWSCLVARFVWSVNFGPFITKCYLEIGNNCLHKCCVYSKCRGRSLRVTDILDVQQ